MLRVIDPQSLVPEVTNRESLDRLASAVGAVDRITPEVAHALGMALLADSADDPDVDVFLFRGVRYRARPLSYVEGAHLSALRLRLTRLQSAPDTMDRVLELRDLVERAATLFYRWSRPVLRTHRLLYRLLPNPFTRMTEHDMGRLLAFFSMCRMRSSVRLSAGARAAVEEDTPGSSRRSRREP